MKRLIILLSIVILFETGCSVSELHSTDIGENIQKLLSKKVSIANVYYDGYQYYCEVSNANGSVISDAATLNVNEVINAYVAVSYPVGAECTATNGFIVLQPASTDAANGTCSFYITAGGNWTFTASDSSDSASTTITIADGDSRNITLSYGASTAISATIYCLIPDGATSYVLRQGSTTVQPTTSSNGTVFLFEISSSGPWSITATNGYNNLSRTVIIANGDNLIIELGYEASGEDEGAPTIVVEPVSQTVGVGSNATFSVSANGNNLSYQWYQRTSSSASWSAISGATSTSYTVYAYASYNGYQYRCVVRNNNGSVTSSAATLTSISAPTITSNPSNASVVVNNNAVFTVAASGIDISYQWQCRTSSSGSWANISGATNTSYSVTATANNNGYQYRCIVSNLGGSATMCGDPPNIIIGTALHLSFFDFVLHPGLIAFVCMFLVTGYFYLVYRKELVTKEVTAEDIATLPEPRFAIKNAKEFTYACVIFACAVVMLVSHAQTGLTVAFIGTFVSILTMIL